ncbi:MAG TPA: TonB-dependent receptor [Steroidobacteraceae bacterium]|nr:TonB-dependent receptor [Steroidobacteraceae bacterium]
MQTGLRAPWGVDQERARRAASYLLAGLLAVGATDVALADAGATDAGADVSAGAPYNLTEVVVTSRRREESLQDVPLAETVRTGADLQQQSAVLFEDAVQGVPNTLAFRSARSVSALEITMRGQTAIPSSIVYDPAVGLYINGVYVAEGQAAMGTLLDIDNVEIVRGTQGTLFGRNNTGGSVSIHTRAPQLDGYSGEFALAGGNDGLFGARAIVNVPLASTLAVRFAYQDNQHQGWGSSIVTGQNNFMDQHRYQARGSLLWQPGADFAAEITYERFRANEAGGLLHPLPGTLAAMIPGDTVPQDFYQTDAGKLQNDFAVTNAWGLNLHEHFSEALQARLIAGYRELFADNDYDADAMAASIADVTLNNTSYQKSAELQLSGKLLEERFDWVGGLYWFHDHGAADSVLAPGLSSPLPTYDINSVDNRSKAAYLHGEYKLTDAWHVAAGARRTEDERALDDNAYVDTSPLPPGQFCTIVDASDPNNPIPIGAETGGPCPPIHRSVTYHYWSWELSTDYRFNPDLMVYLRGGRGQRSGGWNIPVNTLQDAPFKPEQLTDVELGVKANELGGRLTLTADVFTGNYDDMQRLLAQLIGNTPTTLVINAGKARVSGAETEAGLVVTQRLRLQGSFGYTWAQYLEFTDPQGQDQSHNAFYMTPKYDAAASGIYSVPLSLGRLQLRADYDWHSALEFNVINDFNREGSVGVLNARASFTAASGALEATLFGTNLADKRYAYTGGTIVNPGTIPVASWQAAADRRLYGVEVAYRFSRPL